MYTRETKKTSIWIEMEEKILIKRLVREQFGNVTITEIIDEMAYMTDQYINILKMLRKISNDWYADLDMDEVNALSFLIGASHNSDTITDDEMEVLKSISDAISVIKDELRTI